ncbi:AmmeMemoRadiSam system protein A [Aggregatilinea lenta]|uniref:AmmeMemoRadiSam system protein A n=1 Tax=Aggregatilinea lenta TaxID=913108 RepID=UPI000E5B34D3|nr:AmmeMemoRadiSam system protein A [Aggregatilinea lenta]
MTGVYTPDEQRTLLTLARLALDEITLRRVVPYVDLDVMPPALREPRACFVTLRQRGNGELRGCTGTLVAQRALAEEVVITTGQTALHDPRFMPVTAPEVPDLHIEISVLTPPQPLTFDSPNDLIARLRPGVDGVTLRLAGHRATFLPQVWESASEPALFLALLSQKMGFASDAWRSPDLEVDTYQASVIQEPE